MLDAVVRADALFPMSTNSRSLAGYSGARSDFNPACMISEIARALSQRRARRRCGCVGKHREEVTIALCSATSRIQSHSSRATALSRSALLDRRRLRSFTTRPVASPRILAFSRDALHGDALIRTSAGLSDGARSKPRWSDLAQTHSHVDVRCDPRGAVNQRRLSAEKIPLDLKSCERGL